MLGKAHAKKVDTVFPDDVLYRLDLESTLDSYGSLNVNFLNVPSCPAMTSEDPAQQWLALSDPIYPGGIQQIL